MGLSNTDDISSLGFVYMDTFSIFNVHKSSMMLHCTRKQYNKAGHFLSDVFPFIVFDSQHRIKFMSDIRTTFV